MRSSQSSARKHAVAQVDARSISEQRPLNALTNTAKLLVVRSRIVVAHLVLDSAQAATAVAA